MPLLCPPRARLHNPNCYGVGHDGGGTMLFSILKTFEKATFARRGEIQGMVSISFKVRTGRVSEGDAEKGTRKENN